MLTLIPSMSAGLMGIVFVAALLGADWYIWDFRYQISRQRAPKRVALRAPAILSAPTLAAR